VASNLEQSSNKYWTSQTDFFT